MDGLQFTAIYTLQHGLAGHTKSLCGHLHRNIAFWSILDKERLQFIGDTDAPGRTWRDLLTSDKAIVEPAVECRGCNIEDFRRLPDSDWLPLDRKSVV